MVAHVGDFGVAKFLIDHPASTTLGTRSSSIGIKGTVGYIAPEYGMVTELNLINQNAGGGLLPFHGGDMDRVDLADFSRMKDCLKRQQLF
ncbi:hypothetical protein QYF36_026268 [Acer negundo]|nr:hypothetical protein QYF36_026268 [Acer negundo]